MSCCPEEICSDNPRAYGTVTGSQREVSPGRKTSAWVMPSFLGDGVLYSPLPSTPNTSAMSRIKIPIINRYAIRSRKSCLPTTDLDKSYSTQTVRRPLPLCLAATACLISKRDYSAHNGTMLLFVAVL